MYTLSRERYIEAGTFFFAFETFVSLERIPFFREAMKKHLESNFLDEILPCEHFEMKAFELNFYVAWFPVQEIFPSRNILN